MPYEHKDVIEAQWKVLAREREQAVLDYNQCNDFDDGDGVMAAANRIIDVDARRAALEGIARNLVMQQAQPQSNRYGLSQDELDVARSCNLSPEAYSHNKNLLQYRRATGQYRDDQGSVKR
jgi:hypothetical protein